MKVIETITKQIDWYYSTKNRSLDSLIELQRGLSCNSFYLASYLANMKKEYNIAYFNRKINVNRSKQGFIQNKMTLGKAEVEAIDENFMYIEEELNREAEAFKCEVLLKQVNKILSSIQQEISNLKEERKQSITQV